MQVEVEVVQFVLKFRNSQMVCHATVLVQHRCNFYVTEIPVVHLG